MVTSPGPCIGRRTSAPSKRASCHCARSGTHVFAGASAVSRENDAPTRDSHPGRRSRFATYRVGRAAGGFRHQRAHAVLRLAGRVVGGVRPDGRPEPAVLLWYERPAARRPPAPAAKTRALLRGGALREAGDPRLGRGTKRTRSARSTSIPCSAEATRNGWRRKSRPRCLDGATGTRSSCRRSTAASPSLPC